MDMNMLMSDIKTVITSLQDVLTKLKPNSIEYFELETQVVALKLMFCKVRNEVIKFSTQDKEK
jgi:hypothetical protein